MNTLKRAAVAVLIAGAAFAVASPAQATEQPSDACYEQVTQDKINKEVKGTVEHKVSGPNYFTNFDWVDYPGAGPVWDDGRSRSGPHSSEWEVNHGNHTDEYRSTEYRYVVVDTRQVNGDRIPCPPPETPEPTFTEWVSGYYECGDDFVAQTRVKTTYGWVLEGYVWVPTSTETTETRNEPVPPYATIPCITTTTSPPTTQPPTTQPPTTEPPTTQPPTTQPPITNPPVTDPPVTSPPVVTAPPALPETGSSGTTWMALIGAAFLASGAGVTALVRRR